MEHVTLKTPSMQGNIYVGDDALEARLPILLQGQKNFVLTDSNVYTLYKNWFERHFKNVEIFVMPAGEENKNFQSLYEILLKMAGAGMHRTSRLFAVGGGVIGDIGGLAAALFMRGISCVQIPTTLLAQVDSSVGGKTAVDLDGAKNIVGAFYQPCEVVVCPQFLSTLPQRELKCGIGEIIKYAALNAEVFDLLESNVDNLSNIHFLTALITACIRHKTAVVERDEKESGERKSLNVGHTTGHAIELAYGLSHGESVLYGMRLETKIAIREGACNETYGNRLLVLIDRALALEPIASPNFSNIADCADKAKLDKKNTDDGNIQMAVAKSKGEWTMLAMPFERYKAALTCAVND